jgi:acyl carrier protein
MSHIKKFEEYAAARREYEAAKAEASRLEGIRRKLESELVDAMVEAGVKSYQTTDGVTVSLKKRFDISVNQENAEQVEEWLMKTVGDVTPFQKFVLYKPAIVKWLKKEVEEERIDDTTAPQFLNMRSTPGIALRGWKGESEDE